GFLFAEPVADEKAWARVMTGDAPELLAAAAEALRGLAAWEVEPIQAALEALVGDRGVKPNALYQPIRVAITGGTVSPGIFESLAALGREASLARIDAALERLSGEQSRPRGHSTR